MSEFPSLNELETFFGVAPDMVVADEGLCEFKISDGELALAVSINEVSGSFQTSLFHRGVLLSTVSFEGLNELMVLGDTLGLFLRAVFHVTGADVKCIVRIRPHLVAEWSGIAL